MAVRKSKAVATVTEAKVADTPAAPPRARAKAIEAKPTEIKAEATEAAPAVSVPPAAAPEIGLVMAEAVPVETQAPVSDAPSNVPEGDVPEIVATQTGTALETAIEAAPAQMRISMETTMEQATKATEGLMKAAEQATEFSRGNLEAITKATQLYVAGVQDLGKQTMAMMQGLADHTVASAKALGSVKSLKEAAEIQATFTRAAMEKSFAEAAKLQEAALKLAETSFAPLSARMTLAVEKFAKPLAA